MAEIYRTADFELCVPNHTSIKLFKKIGQVVATWGEGAVYDKDEAHWSFWGAGPFWSLTRVSMMQGIPFITIHSAEYDSVLCFLHSLSIHYSSQC